MLARFMFGVSEKLIIFVSILIFFVKDDFIERISYQTKRRKCNTAIYSTSNTQNTHLYLNFFPKKVYYLFCIKVLFFKGYLSNIYNTSLLQTHER